MKRMLGTLMVWATLCATVQAEERMIALRPGEGISHAMERGGCHASWLVRVMMNNDISLARLRLVQPGTPLALPEGCEVEAPADVRDWSTLILEVDEGKRKLAEGITGIQSRLDTLQKERDNLEESQKKILEESRALRAEIAALQNQANQVDSAAPLQWEGWTSLLLAVLLGALVTGLCWLIWWRRLSPQLEKRMVVPQEQIVSYRGRTFVFTLYGEPTYQCPVEGCHERHIKVQNLMGHLKTHRELHGEPEAERFTLASRR